MAYYTKESYDTEANSASIEIYQDTILIGSYEFSGGIYHADERTGTVEAPPGDWTVVNAGQEWARVVSSKIDTGSSIVSEHKYEVEKNGDNIKVKLDINSVRYLDIEWSSATGLITVKPRPEMNLSWADFSLYMSMLVKFKDLVSNFYG
jgi:hypothetical protein